MVLCGGQCLLPQLRSSTCAGTSAWPSKALLFPPPNHLISVPCLPTGAVALSRQSLSSNSSSGHELSGHHSPLPVQSPRPPAGPHPKYPRGFTEQHWCPGYLSSYPTPGGRGLFSWHGSQRVFVCVCVFVCLFVCFYSEPLRNKLHPPGAITQFIMNSKPLNHIQETQCSRKPRAIEHDLKTVT